MPYSLNTDQTPNALRITRLITHGKITDDEAVQLMKELAPGAAHHGLPMLIVNADNTEVTAAARRIFTTQVGNDASRPAAIVTTSVVMRVTVNFIGRVNGNHSTKLFATEAEAVAWLEQTCLKKDLGR